MVPMDPSSVLNVSNFSIFRVGNSHLEKEAKYNEINYHKHSYPGDSVLKSFEKISNDTRTHRSHGHTHLAVDFGGNEVHDFMRDFYIPPSNPNIQTIINRLQNQSNFHTDLDPCGLMPLYPSQLITQLDNLVINFSEKIMELGRILEVNNFILRLPGPRLLRNQKEGCI